MEPSKMVNVSDINRKRSSLKHPMHSEEMKKLIEMKKNLHFDLEAIPEKKEEETVSINFPFIYLLIITKLLYFNLLLVSIFI